VLFGTCLSVALVNTMVPVNVVECFGSFMGCFVMSECPEVIAEPSGAFWGPWQLQNLGLAL